jgi:tetratricopeptide (TPR) repeat protein
MTPGKPLRVELTLQPAGPESPPGTFLITLSDLSRTSVMDVGNTRLNPEMLVDGLDSTVGDLVELFTARRGLRHAEGLAFGRFLHRRLLGASEKLRGLWREIDAHLRAGRTLHFLVVLPAPSAEPDGREPPWPVADLPFELLADDRGFLFQRSGNVLVRTFHGLTRRTPSIPQGGKATVAWANPQILGASGALEALSADVFSRHEDILAQAAPTLGLKLVPPCDRATRRRLDAHLRKYAPVHLVSIVAHGAAAGGAMLLHDERDGQTADAHAPVPAQQLATILRAGGVDVALLWTCHGARRHRDIGSLVEALLRPDGGDVPVVVASHAALEAAATVDMARVLFEALSGAARRDFERALSETWQRALGADDLQWAAPVYYARPEPAQPARIEAAMAAADQRAAPEPELVLIDQPDLFLHPDTLRAFRSVFSPPAFDYRQIFSTRSTRAVALDHAPPLTEHFRGRHAEMNRGVALLAERRLVSIHGMPGIGKTTLSLAIAAHTLAHGNFDRAVWYALDGARTADVLAARLAQDAQAQDMDAAAIARAMGHNTTWLVVLDNAEDLIDADRTGMLRFLDTLLREHAGVRFLLTTRRRLGDLPAAREGLLRVSQIEPPHDLALFKATAGERLTLEVRDGDEVRELVALLDGHPQSIVLVASQVDLFSLATIRHRIERDDVAAVVAPELIGDQDTGDGATAQRARRLLASLDLSYQPLAGRHPAAAEMFAWLGALPVGLPAVLAPKVFGEDADERIAVLLQYNLVEQRGPDRRLSMPAPLRWYAARHIEALSEGRRRALLAATTHALADWVSGMKSQADTPAGRHAIDRAVAEQPNLAALMARVAAVADPALAEACSYTAAYWSQVMQHGGRTTAAIPVVEQAHAMQPPGSEGEADALLALGNLYMHINRLQEAKQSHLTSLAIYQQIANGLGEANTLLALGHMYMLTDQLPEAEQRYLEALSLYRQIDARLGEANTLQRLGDLYTHSVRLQEAEQSYLAALFIYRQIENRLGEANALLALGHVHMRIDRLPEAEQRYLAARSLYRRIGARLGEANTLTGLGNLALANDMVGLAFAYHQQALALHEEVEHKLGVAAAYGYLARAAWIAGALERAVVLGARAWEILHTIDDRSGQRLVLDDMRRAFDELKNTKGAVAALVLAWELACSLGKPDARALGEFLARMTDGLDPASAPPAELVAQARSSLAEAIQACRNALVARGEDPLDPLPGIEDKPAP